MLKNIPVNMQGHSLMVSQPPALKMRVNDQTGQTEAAVDYQGNRQFVVSLIARPKPKPGEFERKGEEIRVTLSADPGEGFTPGTFIELIDAMVSHWERNGRSGLSFKAAGLKPVDAEVPVEPAA